MYLPINKNGKLIKYSEEFNIGYFIVIDNNGYVCTNGQLIEEGVCYLNNNQELEYIPYENTSPPKLRRNIIIKTDLDKVKLARENLKTSNASMTNRKSNSFNKGTFIPELYDDDNIFNKIIKKYIIDNNIDITKFAKTGELEYSTITNIKNGLRTNRVMTLERFLILTNLFGLSIEVLVKDSTGTVIASETSI